jgi:AcrR family transcriptional regulator
MRDRERSARPVLSGAKIVRCVVQLADGEGVDVRSMRRIATELGTGTTSLYRHLTSQGELIELMVDTARSSTRTAPVTAGRASPNASAWRCTLPARRKRLGPQPESPRPERLWLVGGQTFTRS